MLVDQCFAVSELTRGLDLAADLGEMLDRVSRDHRRIPCRSTRHQHDLVHVGEPVGTDTELGQHHHPQVVDATAKRVADRLGLLVNLLEQEVRKAVLLRLLGLPVDGDDARLDGGTVELLHRDPGGCRGDDLAFTKQRNPLRVGDQRGDVAAHEHLSAPESDHQWRIHARAHHAIGLVCGDHDQRARALHAIQRAANGACEVTLEGVLDEVGHDLGVCLAQELVPA